MGVKFSTVAYRCPECKKTWTIFDDPDEYAYGHDCEDESSEDDK